MQLIHAKIIIMLNIFIYITVLKHVLNTFQKFCLHLILVTVIIGLNESKCLISAE